MNKITHSLLFIFSILLFSACSSSVKLKDSWKSDDFGIIKNKKILVINKFNREGLRQRGEREIADKLRAQGIDAVEAFMAFPNTPNSDSRTPEEIDSIVRIIIDAGYNGIVITKVKSGGSGSATTRITEGDEMIEQKKIDESFDTSSYGKYPVSFGVYYNNPAGNVPNKTAGPGGLEETTDNYKEVFELETLTYGMGTDYEQLIGSLTIKITDPEDIMNILSEYAVLVTNQFKQK